MIRHIVMWKLAAMDEAPRAAHAETIASGLRGLVGVVPEILALEVGVDISTVESNWHVVLVADYASFDALAAYQQHPQHKTVGAFIGSVTAERSCVDYELPD